MNSSISGAARFAIFQAITFSLLNCLSGQFVFLTYGSNIIEKSGTHLSSELASISMALVQLLATFVASVLIDSKGRKMLLVVSTGGCTLSHAVMTAYLYLYNNGVDTSMFHWTPAICMSAVIFTASIGIVPLTLICMVECFPIKTRSFGVTLGTIVLNVFSFIFSKSFPILEHEISLQGCLMIFSISCALGTLFTIFFVKETKGIDLNEVTEDSKLSRIESNVAATELPK